MPVKKELRVEVVDNYAKGIRLGDELTLPRGITGIVESMETKQAYMHITLVGGTKGRLPLRSEVNIQREVPTQDEENAAGMFRVTEKLQKEWEWSKSRMREQLNKLTERYNDHMEKGYLNPVDLDLAAELKLTEFRWRLWEEARNRMIDVMTDTATPEGGAALRAVMGVRYNIEKELSTRTFRALSRSTSVIGNLEEDMFRQAKVDFLDETKYWGVEELWENVGTVL